MSFRKKFGVNRLFIPTKEMIIDCVENCGVSFKFDSAKRNIMMNAPFFGDDHDYKLYVYIGENTPKVNRGAWNHFRSGQKSLDFIKLFQEMIGERDYNRAKMEFIKRFLGVDDIENFVSSKKQEIAEKPKFISFSFPEHFRKLTELDTEYIEYLSDRKIDWTKHKLYVNEQDRRIVFPMYIDGNLVSYSQRTIDNDPTIARWTHAYKKDGDESVVMYGLDNCSMRAYVFEGIIDAISYGTSSIAMMKSVISDNQIDKMVKHGIRKIYYVGDNDDAADKVRYSNLLKFHQFFETYYYDWKESGYSGKDEKDFADIKKKYGEIKTEGLFKKFNKLKYELEEKVVKCLEH